MLAIQVGDDSYELSDASAEALVRRVPHPPLGGGEPVSGSLLDKLQDAIQHREPALLDDAELAVLGAVIEAWASEVAVDAADVQALRDAIRNRLG